MDYDIMVTSLQKRDRQRPKKGLTTCSNVNKCSVITIVIMF